MKQTKPATARMSGRLTRDGILEALQDRPPDATVDDAIERLVFLAKIDAGIAELDDGKGISHAELNAASGRDAYRLVTSISGGPTDLASIRD